MKLSWNQSKKNDRYSLLLTASAAGAAADKESWQSQNKMANTAKPRQRVFVIVFLLCQERQKRRTTPQIPHASTKTADNVLNQKMFNIL